MTNSMDDVSQNAALFFVIGSNTTEQHPVFGTMLRRAVRFRGAKLIVADPRRIDLVDFATIHLQQKPGTDIALLNGLMYLILENGHQNNAFIDERTEGYEDFVEVVRQYPPDLVSQITGVPEELLRQAAELMGTSKPMATMWTLGITQHVVGVRNVFSLSNLQMLLGNIGIPGGGANPLRGQNNVQGACDMGGLPNVYPAYQPVSNEAVRLKFSQAWGASHLPNAGDGEISVNGLDPRDGKTVTELVPEILEGKTKALYVMGENPITSEADSGHVRHCFQAIDFLAIQDIFPTESTEYADILLPGVNFAEKDGTVTNTERRVQMVRKAIPNLGDARQDWEIIADLSKLILANPTEGERTLDLTAPWAGWDYQSPNQIMGEVNALAPSYAGITHQRLNNGERLQWPVPSLDHPGTPILHTKGFTRGKGRFMPVDHIPAPELPDDEYPMTLSTGRVLYHWHGGAITRRSKGLSEIYDEALIELSPQDAIKLSVNGNSRVKVSSRRGSIVARAWITDRVPEGMVFANFHFPEANANELTLAELDPIAKIPTFKVCAIKVELASEPEPVG